MRVAKFSKDGSLIITASGHSNRRGYGHPRTDNEMRFWDADTGRRRLVKDLRHDHELMTLVFGPGNAVAVNTSGDRTGGGRMETLQQDQTVRL